MTKTQNKELKSIKLDADYHQALKMVSASTGKDMRLIIQDTLLRFPLFKEKLKEITG